MGLFSKRDNSDECSSGKIDLLVMHLLNIIFGIKSLQLTIAQIINFGPSEVHAPAEQLR